MAKRKRKPRITQPIPDLDIIIPVYGQPDLLRECLDSIPNALDGLKAQIILVDDQGPDQDKLDVIYKSLNGSTKLIRNRENSGFPRSVNTGVSITRAPLILLLNTDIVLEPDSIAVMAGNFDDQEIGVIGPKLLFADDHWQQKGTVQHAGIAIGTKNEIIHANLGWPADHPKVNERREMAAMTGACLMTSRKCWQQVLAEYRSHGDPTLGAMNEIYSPGTCEDIEYCFAARAHEYKVIYEPEAVGWHYVGSSSARQNKYFALQRNLMIFNARCGHLLMWDEWLYL